VAAPGDGHLHRARLDRFHAGDDFELRAAPSDGGSTVEMVLDRTFRPAGWGRVGYALNRILGRRGFEFMLRQALKSIEKQAALVRRRLARPTPAELPLSRMRAPWPARRTRSLGTTIATAARLACDELPPGWRHRCSTTLWLSRQVETGRLLPCGSPG
jgi:hypothetical protein